jgi:hypothetical protein
VIPAFDEVMAPEKIAEKGSGPEEKGEHFPTTSVIEPSNQN